MARDQSLFAKRNRANRIGLTLSTVAMSIGMLFLLWILSILLYKGFSAISPSLFLASTPAPGTDGGGLANPIVGSLMIVFFCTLISTPVIGLFVYAIIVYQVKHFSGWAGTVALALIAIPVVVRTTENMLKLVPTPLREAAFALGAPKWKVSLTVVLRAAKSGVITGVLLALARVSGETAPLLFTALNNQFFSTNMNAPMANLPVVIFQFAMSPYDNWINLAWGGALLITFAVLGLNILARVVLREKVSV